MLPYTKGPLLATQLGSIKHQFMFPGFTLLVKIRPSSESFTKITRKLFKEVREAQRLLYLPQSVPQRDPSKFALDCIEEDGHNLIEGVCCVMLNHNMINLVKKIVVRMPHKVTFRSKAYFSD